MLAAHGRIDVLVNDAGAGALGYLEELSADDVERVYCTNVVAVADLTRLVLPGLRARGAGDVVMLSSVAAWASVPPATVYSSSSGVRPVRPGDHRSGRRCGAGAGRGRPGPLIVNRELTATIRQLRVDG